MDPWSKVGIWLAVGVPTMVFMEVWAAVLHGKVWHSLLYTLHESHHVPRTGRWEKNDLLSFTHAPIAIALILYGCLAAETVGREVAYGIGMGMTVFGIAYIVVHDGLVHKRLPVDWLARWRYFRLVRNAHDVHHRTGAVPYGLFFGPWAVKRYSRQRQAQRQA